MINFEYPPLGGGGGVATHDMARELAKRHTVHVLTTAFHDLPRKETIEGVVIHRVPVLGRVSLPTATFLSLVTFAPSALLAGIRIMKEIQFNVVYAQFVIPSGLPAALLAQLFRIPFVLTFIGGDIYDPSKGISPHRHVFLRAMIRYIASTADARTAISSDTKKRATELHGVTEEITVVPIGLKQAPFSKVSRTEFGFSDEDNICISIGRLVPRKGYDTLLAAWKKIPNAKLIIIGDGPLKLELTEKIKTHGLTGRVQLFGQVDEQKKLQLLSVADIYVSAAQHEGFGIVFLEAMQAGLPIVAANDGGQTDFLHAGKNALLLPPHDSDGFAESIATLLKDETLRHAMGERNLQDVQEYYLERTVSIIENILIQTAHAYEHRN